MITRIAREASPGVTCVFPLLHFNVAVRLQIEYVGVPGIQLDFRIALLTSVFIGKQITACVQNKIELAGSMEAVNPDIVYAERNPAIRYQVVNADIHGTFRGSNPGWLME